MVKTKKERNDICLKLKSLNLDQTAKSVLQIFKQVEPEIKGKGLLVYVNCEYESIRNITISISCLFVFS